MLGSTARESTQYFCVISYEMYLPRNVFVNMNDN